MTALRSMLCYYGNLIIAVTVQKPSLTERKEFDCDTSV